VLIVTFLTIFQHLVGTKTCDFNILVDEVLDSDDLRKQIDEAFEMATTLEKEKREAETEEKENQRRETEQY